MSIAPKILVNRMTPSAREMLEAAIGRAATAQHYEVTIEHMLSKMVGDDGGDVAAICRAARQDRRAIARRVETILRFTKGGCTSRPVFSGNLWKWMQDGWLYGSLEYGAQRIRTGHLFYTLLLHPGRYIGETIPELEDIDVEGLRAALPETLSTTREEIESMPIGQASAPGSRPSDPLERELAAMALRRGAPADRLIAALRERRDRLASQAGEWVELLAAALEHERDPKDAAALDRAARATDAALAALRSEPAGAPHPPPTLRLVHSQPEPDAPAEQGGRPMGGGAAEEASDLHHAAREGDLAKTEALLRAGASVHRIDEAGGTALLEAVAAGHAEVVAALLRAGADPNRIGGETEAALGDHGSPWIEKATALHYAAVGGRPEIVALLLGAGADPNGSAAAEAWSTDAPLLWALTSDDGVTRHHVEVADQLLAAGARVDARTAEGGDTALHLAAAASSVAMVRLLLRHGADPRATNRSGASPSDLVGEDSLDPSTLDNRHLLDPGARPLSPLLRLFAEAGVDLPIEQLVSAGDAKKIGRWLERGGDPNAAIRVGSSFSGHTEWPLLLFAARKGHRAAVELLRAKGAEPSATTSDGVTLLECAAEGGLLELVKELAPLAPAHALGRAVGAAARGGAANVVAHIVSLGPDLLGHRPVDEALRSLAPLETKKAILEALIAGGVIIDEASIQLLKKADDALARRNTGIRADHRERAALIDFLSARITPAPAPVDPNGLLPKLWRAIARGRADEVRALAAAGADLERGREPKWGETALGAAIAAASPEVVRVLLEAGADVDACGRSGLTPLHQAASYGQAEVVELLLARGADRERRSPDGKSALELAGDDEVRRLLERA